MKAMRNMLNEVRLSIATNASRKSTNHSYKSTKLTTLHNPLSKPQSRMHFRTISSSNKTEQTVINAVQKPTPIRVVAQSNNLAKGMNDNFLFLRKENHLNTQFMLRKKKLKEITKTNKQIYSRLNSQKSLYSNQDLNKSYQSTKQIKERLSQSKLSHRLNTSQGSSRKSLKVAAASRVNKKGMNIQLKAKDINALDKGEINKFKGLFIRGDETHQKENEENMKFNSHRQKKINMNKTARQPIHPCKEYKEEGILHRVAQLLNQDEGTKQVRRRSLVMPKNKKLFRF